MPVEHRLNSVGIKVKGLGLKFLGLCLEFRVQGSGFRVQGEGSELKHFQSSTLRLVESFGSMCRVKGLGLRVLG